MAAELWLNNGKQRNQGSAENKGALTRRSHRTLFNLFCVVYAFLAEACVLLLSVQLKIPVEIFFYCGDGAAIPELCGE